MTRLLHSIKGRSFRDVTVRVFYFLTLCLVISGLAQYVLYPHGDRYILILRSHSYLGIPTFAIFMLYLFVETTRIATWKAALPVALYPFFCIASVMTPSPLIVVFIFDSTFIPAFLYFVVKPHVKPSKAGEFNRASILAYLLVMTFFTGFFSVVDPILLRFEFFHRKAHGYAAFMLLLNAGYYYVTSSSSRMALERGGKQLLIHTAILMAVSVLLTMAFKWIKTSNITESYRLHSASTHEMAHLQNAPFRPIDGSLLGDSEECAACHPIPYRQWARSVHAFAARNKSFQTTVQSLIDQKGPEFARHCATCHDPSVALSEDPSLLTDPDHVQKSEGVSCRACHYMVHQGDQNGAYTIALPRADVLYRDPEKRRRYILTSVLEHVSDVTKPITKDGTQCYPCHRLNVTKVGSVVSPLDNVTSFIESPYATELGMKCHDCHMPRLVRDQRSYTWRDHQFLGIQTILPAVAINVDDDMLSELEQFTKDNTDWLFGRLAFVSPLEMFMDETFKSYRIYNYTKALTKVRTIRDMLKVPSAFEIRMASHRINDSNGQLELQLTFSTTNKTIGHDFPSPLFANIVRSWFELKVIDGSGTIVYRAPSGEPAEELLGRIEIDKNGRPILPHESPTYVRIVNTDRHLRPLQDYITTYTIELPMSVRFPLHVSYALVYKRYDDAYMRWISGDGIVETPRLTLASQDFVIPGPAVAGDLERRP